MTVAAVPAIPKLLIDTNVVLDVVLDREPWVEDATVLLDAIASGRAEGHIAGHTVTTVYYIVERARSRSVAATAVNDLLQLLNVVPLGRADFQRALGFGLRDYEDGPGRRRPSDRDRLPGDPECEGLQGCTGDAALARRGPGTSRLADAIGPNSAIVVELRVIAHPPDGRHRLRVPRAPRAPAEPSLLTGARYVGDSVPASGVPEDLRPMG